MLILIIFEGVAMSGVSIMSFSRTDFGIAYTCLLGTRDSKKLSLCLIFQSGHGDYAAHEKANTVVTSVQVGGLNDILTSSKKAVKRMEVCLFSPGF